MDVYKSIMQGLNEAVEYTKNQNPKVRIIIAGSRDFDDYVLLTNKCSEIIYDNTTLSLNDIEIISGTAKGADKLGEQFAIEYDIPIKQFPAKWDDLEDQPCKISYNKYGEPYNILAGHNRNKEMAKYASEENGILIVFWNGVSKGTKNMLKLGTEYGLKVYVINY